MEILFLNHNIKNTGTYIRCFNFAKHLVRFGHSVVILTSTPRYIVNWRKEFIDGVEVICMPDLLGKRFRNGGLGPIDTLLRCFYLFKRKFDIVENFDHRPAVLYPAIVSKYIQKTPLISEWTDLHGTGGSMNNRRPVIQKLIRLYEDFTEKKSKKLAEKLVVISQGLKERALNLGIPESKILYIPGGSDIENIVPRQKKEIRKSFGLPLEKKIIAYTAGTHYDSDLFLNAIYRIQEQRQDVLLITTGSVFGDQIKKRLYDPQRVIEFGFLAYEKYAALLPAVDAFIFPFANSSLNRGRWPNKIGDYMAAGRPTISNRTGDMIALFEKYHIGLLASDSPQDLAQTTLKLLTNEQLMFELGHNARATAETQFDWKILSRKLETCFIETAILPRSISNKHRK
jgi:glycosyltransferase involved in cell wall biosynthesis